MPTFDDSTNTEASNVHSYLPLNSIWGYRYSHHLQVFTRYHFPLYFCAGFTDTPGNHLQSWMALIKGILVQIIR